MRGKLVVIDGIDGSGKATQVKLLATKLKQLKIKFKTIDRYESSQQIKLWLKQGYIVIADRYASANQIHQGGKIVDPKRRKVFLAWLDEMEYSVFQIPRPDLVVYLDVPFEVSKVWLQKKVLARKKKYLKGRKDVAEDNLIHLKNSRASALSLVRQNKNWVRIECCKGKVCLSPKEVSKQILQVVIKKVVPR